MSDTELRRLYWLSPSNEAAAEHLDEATWERLALDELPPKDREQALAHVVRCRRCTSIYQALLRLREEAAANDPTFAADDAGRPAGLRRRRLIAGFAIGMAAAIALAVVAPPSMWNAFRRAAPQPSIRRSETSPRAAPMTVIQPTGIVGDRPAVAQWEPAGPRATGYRVRIFAMDGQPLWTSDVTPATRIDIPSGVLPRPAAYFWYVTALDGAETVAESPVVSFEWR
jgi:hypothetical protein